MTDILVLVALGLLIHSANHYVKAQLASNSMRNASLSRTDIITKTVTKVVTEQSNEAIDLYRNLDISIKLWCF